MTTCKKDWVEIASGVKSGQLFIGVDWGTSSMRAMLCSHTHEEPIDIRFGAGVSKREGRRFEAILTDAVGDWLDQFGGLPMVITGMAGANIGWYETPYIQCPAAPEDVLPAAVRFRFGRCEARMLPGVRGQNAMAQPEVMRGEELQILGWMAANPKADQENSLLCLPGTHCKWVRLADGKIQSFATALTGELFATLQKHTVLLPSEFQEGPQPFDEKSFLTGVDLVRRYPNALLHQLFSTRSRWLSDPSTISNPHSYLSGLLIGGDTMTALAHCGKTKPVIELIGDTALCDRYKLAAEFCGFDCKQTQGDMAAFRGFQALIKKEAEHVA